MSKLNYLLDIDVSIDMLNKCMKDDNENNKIRIPHRILKKFNIELHNFIDISCKDGSTISLKVDRLLNDMDNNKCWVTPLTFNIINMNHNKNTSENFMITVGADIELLIHDRINGLIVHANNFFKDDKQAQIGVDNNLVEIRPTHSYYVKDLVQNIKVLLKKIKFIINNKNYILRGMPSLSNNFIGFHIHFGVPDILNKLINKNEILKNNIWQIVTNIFDYYLAIPFIITETFLNTDRRCSLKSIYGKPGDFRAPNQNVTNTYEYRLLSGRVLAHEILTYDALYIAKLLYNEIIYRLKSKENELNTISSIIDIYDILNFDIDDINIENIICGSKKNLIKEIPKITKKLNTISSENYNIIKLINNGDYLNITTNIDTNWEL